MGLEVFSNLPTTTVSSGGTAAPSAGTQETWTVGSSSSFPAVSSTATPPTQIHVADTALNSEMIEVINISGTTWTVIRGAESTTPVTHSAGFTIYQVVSAGALSGMLQSAAIYEVNGYGADPTGSADSTAAFQAAVAAMPVTTVNNGVTSASYPVGTLMLGIGTYKLGSSGDIGNLGPFVGVTGPGSTACYLYYYGTGGDCLRAYNAIKPSDNTFDTMFSQAAPYGLGTKFDGFTIDGTNAAGVSSGLHIGDFEGAVLGPDLHIQNFSTGALSAPSGLSASPVGSGGTFAANTYYWKITGTTRTGESLVSGETSATIVLDGSASLTWSALSGATGYNIYRGTSSGGENTLVTQVGAVTSYTDTGSSVGTGAPAPANSSGSVGLFMDNQNSWTENMWGRVVLYNNATAVMMYGCDSSTGGKSFEYNDLTLKIYSLTGQNGVVLYGGGQYGNGSLKIRANVLLSSGAQNCGLLVITGQAQSGNPAAGQYSLIQFSRLDVQAEANTSGAHSPNTILFGSSSSSRNKIQGCSGVLRFSSFTDLSNWNSAPFNFKGVVSGDTNLNGYMLFQDFLGIFGDGSDGAATLDGTATVGWASKASSVYTLTRDAYVTSLTINSGSTLNMAGWRVFCQGTFTNGGTVQNNGASASGATGGASGTNGIIAGSLGGANGGTGVGAQGTGFAGPGCGTSGAGGTGSSGAGGAQRSQSGDISSLRNPGPALSGTFGWANTARPLSGAGGAGSGAGDGSNSGGGGGGGGGVVLIFALVAVNNGTITANGGNGATPGAGNCGGGGAGGGGIIVIYSLSAVTGSGSTSVTAGTAGSGVGTGTGGSSGTSGTFLNEVLA